MPFFHFRLYPANCRQTRNFIRLEEVIWSRQTLDQEIIEEARQIPRRHMIALHFVFVVHARLPITIDVVDLYESVIIDPHHLRDVCDSTASIAEPCLLHNHVDRVCDLLSNGRNAEVRRVQTSNKNQQRVGNYLGNIFLIVFTCF